MPHPHVLQCYALAPDGRTPVPVDRLPESFWLDQQARTVASTLLGNGLTVSTIFRGVDPGLGTPPRLWETMVFDDDDIRLDQFTTHWTSWDEAQQGHHTVVAQAHASAIRPSRRS